MSQPHPPAVHDGHAKVRVDDVGQRAQHLALLGHRRLHRCVDPCMTGARVPEARFPDTTQGRSALAAGPLLWGLHQPSQRPGEARGGWREGGWCGSGCAARFCMLPLLPAAPGYAHAQGCPKLGGCYGSAATAALGACCPPTAAGSSWRSPCPPHLCRCCRRKRWQRLPAGLHVAAPPPKAAGQCGRRPGPGQRAALKGVVLGPGGAACLEEGGGEGHAAGALGGGLLVAPVAPLEHRVG